LTISATKILHSISPQGTELKSVLARYPRFVHSELMTHRVFSRNASSSRAIPVKRLIDDILQDTAMPIHWGKNQKGMQADHENDALIEQPFADYIKNPFAQGRRGSLLSPEQMWIEARDHAIAFARAYDAAGYHKQVVNRLLEPFAHINVLITASDWDNFFELRDHKDAQPEIQALAKAIKAAFADSEPTPLQPGEWHLPFVTDDEKDGLDLKTQIKVSVARCARTSYLTHEGKPPMVSKDLQLYHDLVGARPLHASPAEHQATPDVLIKGHEGPYGEWRVDRWQNAHQHGNFRGWIQNRKIIERDILSEAA
jgi:hypothetical protein